MPVFDKIQEHQDSFSKSELKIAQFILDQPQEVLEMTAQQLATASGSSSAAVIRLCKRIKVYGFPQLKIELSADLSGGVLSSRTRPEVQKNEELGSIKEKLLATAQHSLNETVKELDDRQISKVGNLISQSTRMVVFGSGSSNLVAKNIAKKWGQVGINVIAFETLTDLLPVLANATDNDLLWVVSNSGELPEAIHAAKAAKKKQVPLITMTKKGNNALSEISDVEIHTSQPIEIPGRIDAVDPLLMQFMAVDIIFYDYVSHNYEASISKLEQSLLVMNEYKKDL